MYKILVSKESKYYLVYKAHPITKSLLANKTYIKASDYVSNRVRREFTDRKRQMGVGEKYIFKPCNLPGVHCEVVFTRRVKYRRMV